MKSKDYTALKRLAKLYFEDKEELDSVLLEIAEMQSMRQTVETLLETVNDKLRVVAKSTSALKSQVYILTIAILLGIVLPFFEVSFLVTFGYSFVPFLLVVRLWFMVRGD